MLYNERILIIGGSGSLGNALTTKYHKDNQVCIFSRTENNQWVMKKKYSSNNITYVLGDMRNFNRVEYCINQFKPSIIIIAAAMKHIDFCEKNVEECIDTNVDGITNVLNIGISGKEYIKKIVFVSTDKACAPVNAYGMCKSLSERNVIEKSEFNNSIDFIVVRYGNVINSRGSLIPILNEFGRSSEKECFYITHPDMTRFFMTLESSVELIEWGILNAESGDTVIPKTIQCFNILEIIQDFSERYNKPIKESGIRVGEKLHESLISGIERRRTVEQGDYYIIKPTYKNINHYDQYTDFSSKDDTSSVEDFNTLLKSTSYH